MGWDGMGWDGTVNDSYPSAPHSGLQYESGGSIAVARRCGQPLDFPILHMHDVRNRLLASVRVPHFELPPRAVPRSVDRAVDSAGHTWLHRVANPL